MRRIRTTYEIVTPESAAEGDVAETGWLDEEGAEIVPDSYDIDEHETEERAAVALAVELIGKGAEPSSSQYHPCVWYTDADPDRDYSTGAEERHSYHLSGFSETEERAIFAEVTSN